MIDTLRKQIDGLVEYVSRRTETEGAPLKAKLEVLEYEARLVPAGLVPKSLLAAFFDGTYSTSFDNSTNAYGPNSANQGVIAVAPATGAESLVASEPATFPRSFSDPAASKPIALAVADGKVFVAFSKEGAVGYPSNPYFGGIAAADDASTIRVIDPATGVSSTFAVKGRETLALAPSADGKQLLAAWFDGVYGTANPYGAESATEGVSSFNPATGAETVLFSQPAAVPTANSRLAPKFDAVAAVADRVYVSRSRAGSPEIPSNPPFVAGRAAVDDTSTLLSINPATGVGTPLAAKGRETLALTASADGKLLLASYFDGTYGTTNPYGAESATQGVIAFDPATGNEAVLFAQAVVVPKSSSDPSVQAAKPLALAAIDGQVFVATSQAGNPYGRGFGNDDTSTIIAINLATGTATPFAAKGRETLALAAVPAAPVVLPPANTPPTLTPKAGFAARTVPSGTVAVSGIAFEFADAETPAAAVSVTVTSSNPALLPSDATHIILTRSGGTGSLTLSPLRGAFGSATVTVTVTDAAGLAATNSFVLTVSAPPPAPAVVTADILAMMPALGANPRVTMADVNGDGVADFIGVTGAGGVNMFQVFDGKTRTVIASFSPFEPSFTGGLYVAAGDLSGTGRIDVIVSPDVGGGPIVAVYNGRMLAAGATGDAAQLTRFFGIDDTAFRGGARTATGLVGGNAALVVSAGVGGGPRVAIFDAASVASGTQTPGRLVGDFFVFENTLRNGAYVAAGDVNGDGVADFAFGGGPGGGPRVRVIDGRSLLAVSGSIGTLDSLPLASRLADFFAGEVTSRDGVRVAFHDVFGDGKAELTTQGGAGGLVRVFKPGSLLANPNAPVADASLDPMNGAFVG